MARSPSTRAVLALRQHEVQFTPHLYSYVDRGGTRASAEALGVDEHSVIKTLIFEDQDKAPLIMLMHGDLQVSTKSLARLSGRKSIRPCEPTVANRHSGYQVGGTSPFGTRTSMPVFMQSSIAELDKIYVNGGRRGFLLELAPADLVRVLAPTLVDAAQ